MKVGFAQTDPEFGRIEENVEKAVEMISAMDCDLVVLPELFNTGYQFRSKDELFNLAEGVPHGFTTKRLLSAALSLKKTIVAGIAEKAGEKVYNTAVLISPGKVVGLYRKAHLFWREKEVFTPGDSRYEVFEVMGVNIGMMVCFDWIFPEAARTLALKGADIICHPSNLALPYCPDAMVTRSIENRVFSITANRVGREERIEGEPLTFIGASQVTTPGGTVLLRAGKAGPETGVVEIDPLEARDKKITARNDLFKERRTDLFSL
ncbi:MAG: nitrilase-related carbon-nitrogen hydrolase [Thermodesulfobacteriota bacterium]